LGCWLLLLTRRWLSSPTTPSVLLHCTRPSPTWLCWLLQSPWQASCELHAVPDRHVQPHRRFVFVVRSVWAGVVEPFARRGLVSSLRCGLLYTEIRWGRARADRAFLGPVVLFPALQRALPVLPSLSPTSAAAACARCVSQAASTPAARQHLIQIASFALLVSRTPTRALPAALPLSPHISACPAGFYCPQQSAAGVHVTRQLLPAEPTLKLPCADGLGTYCLAIHCPYVLHGQNAELVSKRNNPQATDVCLWVGVKKAFTMTCPFVFQAPLRRQVTRLQHTLHLMQTFTA
jgi:hypothetical protein